MVIMRAVVIGVGVLFIIMFICMCVSLSASTKDREKIEKELFNEKFGKGDSE